jgi:hypothetical protein
MTILRPERPEAPAMYEEDFNAVFGPWASWIRDAAEVKSAVSIIASLMLYS